MPTSRKQLEAADLSNYAIQGYTGYYLNGYCIEHRLGGYIYIYACLTV